MAKEIRLVETDVWSAIYVDGNLIIENDNCSIDVGHFLSALKRHGIILEDFKDFEVLNMTGKSCEGDPPPSKLSDLTA